MTTSSDSSDSGSGTPRAGFVLPDALLTIETVHQAIDAYLEAGLRPILIHVPLRLADPIDGSGCSCGKVHDVSKSGSTSVGKHPIAQNWQKHDYTREELRDHASRLKFEPNVGMVLGAQPGGQYIVAVDVDDAERFAELETELGKLPETPQCDSGRGHRLFYSLPPGIDPASLKNVTGLRGKPGLDVKAERGQVVIAPSLHANGKKYVWTRAGTIATLPMTWALELVQAPQPEKWIQQKYTPQTLNADGKAKKRAERYFEVAVQRRASNLAACGSGLRNNTLHESARVLFMMCANSFLGGQTWSYVHSQLSQAAQACGLKNAEVRATLASAERWVVESGAVHSLIALSTPERSRAPRPTPQTEPSDPTGETPVADGDVPVEEGWPSPAVEAKTDDRGRPIIKITSELKDNADSALAALCRDENIFQRDKTLVFITSVVHEQEFDPTEDETLPIEGNPQTNVATRAVLKGKLSKVASFQKWVEKEGGHKPVLPHDDIVAYLHDCHEYPGIRPIVGIAETPTLRPDGIIVQETGYDPKTRYVYLPNQSFPVVTDEMATQEQARWAYGFLANVFVDFPYMNPAHLSVPIAAILTLVARPAIQGSVPGFLFDASTRGSGKTLQTDAIATIATGRGAPRMNYPPKDEEMEKVLAGYALKGSSFICLDNVPSMCPFGGGPLDRVLTARDEVDLRVLGHTDVPTLTWRAVVMATGNNIGFRGDTARRVLMARLESTEENPERRTKFEHNDLLAYVRGERPRLVAAALLILRAYFRCGRPPMGCDRWGSFEEWSRLIPNAIVFAGGEDPMKARPESDGEVDVEVQALSTLLGQLPKLAQKLYNDPRAGLAARIVIMALYENPQGPTADWAAFEPLKEAIEILCRPKFGKSSARPDPMALGFKLRSLRKRVIGGNRLVGELDRTGTTVWHVEKVNNSVN